MRQLEGVLDGFPVILYYDCNGFEFTDIGVQIGLVVFDWNELSPMQQEQVYNQLNNHNPLPEANRF